MTAIEVGRVLRAHGLGGELRLLLFFPEPKILAVRSIYLDGELFEIEALRFVDASTALLKLRGVDGRDQAEALIGKALSVDPAEFPPGEEPPPLWVGAEVVLESGEPVGRVDSVMHNGAQAVLVIGEGDDEKLIPAVPEFVIGVERDEHGRRTLRVRPIPGLLEKV
jgi:16S rRNA processing protein RimM